LAGVQYAQPAATGGEVQRAWSTPTRMAFRRPCRGASRANRQAVMSARRLVTGGLGPRVGGVLESPVPDQRRLRRAGQGQAEARRRDQRPDWTDRREPLSGGQGGNGQRKVRTMINQGDSFIHGMKCCYHGRYSSNPEWESLTTLRSMPTTNPACPEVFCEGTERGELALRGMRLTPVSS